VLCRADAAEDMLEGGRRPGGAGGQESAMAEKTKAAVISGRGRSLKLASVTRPSDPNAPTWSLWRSNPVTFFTTRPPERVATPSAPTERVPSRWSRIVP